MQANSGDSDQTLCWTAASDLGLHYLPMSQKEEARHICNYFAYLIRVAEIWEVYC